MKVKIINENKYGKPKKMTPNAAALDIFSNNDKEIKLVPGERTLVKSGIRAETPLGYELQIRPRSGLALKKGVTLVNGPGTIDSDYRGDIGMIVINHGHYPFTIKPGTRIAQMALRKVIDCELVEVDELSGTTRGENGFGHTGAHEEEL